MQWLTEHIDVLSAIAIVVAFQCWMKNTLSKQINEMQKDLKSNDQRLTRLEGRFEERGSLESRIMLRKDREERESGTIPALPLIEVKKRRRRRKGTDGITTQQN